MKRAPATNQNQGVNSPLRIAIRLWDLSEWCRQVVRGVQRFAHDRPNWRVYVDTGTTEHCRVMRGDLKWDGLITAMTSEESELLKLSKRRQIQIVVISAVTLEALKFLPSVRIDDTRVAAAIGQHFAAGGFRRIAYLGNTSAERKDSRADGIVAFATGAGLAFDVYSQKTSGPIHVPSVMRWLKKLPKPVGVATWNMEVAINAIEACQRGGISVPEDVAIVAWDDDLMLAESVEPTISAVVLPAERLGFESARQLDRLLSGRSVPEAPLLIEPSGVLHVRQSSDVSSLADRDVHLAVQFIRENSAKGIKVDQLCKALRVSRRKLEQDFSRVTGQTLHESILQVRLELAKQFLLETDWAMDKIANRSGLGTLRTMYRVFFKRDGCTPAEYRTRWAERSPATT